MIVNGSIVTRHLCVLDMLRFSVATLVIENSNSRELLTLTDLLVCVCFFFSSNTFIRDEHFRLQQYVLRVLQLFDVIVINRSSFYLKQIIQVSS